MRILAVIAEYDPFHQGHARHLAMSRRLSGTDHVLVAMSGNYVQRGAPAMFDKFTRAEAALRGGANLVLELPLDAATGSAERFASGAIQLLEKTGIVTDLCFGSECGNLPALQELADFLIQEPDGYRRLLKEALRAGEPFPKARARALGGCGAGLPIELLSSPNNLLAVEYLKALARAGSSIRPHTVKREGQGYHGRTLTKSACASASALRQALIQGQGHFTEEIRKELPNPEQYSSYEGKPPITEDAFSLPLLQTLRSLEGEPLDGYLDVGRELSNRIWNRLDEFASFSQFTDLLKTRNLTRTAVSRALIHILLGLQKPCPPKAFRVLGYRKGSEALLKELAHRGALPIQTGSSGQGLSREELYPDHLYESVRSLLHRQPYQNECRRRLLAVAADSGCSGTLADEDA